MTQKQFYIFLTVFTVAAIVSVALATWWQIRATGFQKV